VAAAGCAATYWLGEGGGHQGDRSGKHPRLRKFWRQARVTQRELADQMSAAGRKMLPSAICASETGHRLVTIGQVVQFARFQFGEARPQDAKLHRAGRWLAESGPQGVETLI
jgi:hypothetical protein